MSNKTEGLTVLIDEKHIAERVDKLAKQISKDYSGRKPVLVGILKGSFMFMADLARKLEIEHHIEFIDISSYDDDPHHSRRIKLNAGLSREISGEDVLIVEDIVDTGKTLDYIYRMFSDLEPGSLEIVALLDKSERREVDLNIRYRGFDIPDRFVFGYGLDDAEEYRGLPYVAYKS